MIGWRLVSFGEAVDRGWFAGSYQKSLSYFILSSVGDAPTRRTPPNRRVGLLGIATENRESERPSRHESATCM